jgi:ABC-type glycerol-3-phosphate transport system permease component
VKLIAELGSGIVSETEVARIECDDFAVAETVSELVRGDMFYWRSQMAGALPGSIPVAVVYSFFVVHYVAGLTGSVKG